MSNVCNIEFLVQYEVLLGFVFGDFFLKVHIKTF